MEAASVDTMKDCKEEIKDMEVAPLEYKKTETYCYSKGTEKVDTEFHSLLHDVLFDCNGASNQPTQRSEYSITFDPATSSKLEFGSNTFMTPMASSKSASLKCSSPAKKANSTAADGEAHLNYKELRKLRNRQAAARSRQRMQQKLKDLEKLAYDLQRKNRHLENLVQAYAAEKSQRSEVIVNGYDEGGRTEVYAAVEPWQPFQGLDGQGPIVPQPEPGHSGEFLTMMSGMPNFMFDCYPQS